MEFLLKLRIKPEHNPPKIGNSNEEGLIALQKFSIPDNTDIYTPMFLVGLNEMKEKLMNDFCEVITERIE